MKKFWHFCFNMSIIIPAMCALNIILNGWEMLNLETSSKILFLLSALFLGGILSLVLIFSLSKIKLKKKEAEIEKKTEELRKALIAEMKSVEENIKKSERLITEAWEELSEEEKEEHERIEKKFKKSLQEKLLREKTIRRYRND